MSHNPVTAVLAAPRMAPTNTRRRDSRSEPAEAAWVPVVTLILWGSCVLIGGLGVLLPYERPQASAPVIEPVVAELLTVELSNDPLTPPHTSPPLSLAQPPPMTDRAAPSSAPPLLTVAEPTPAIAFALPVEGPAPVVDAAQAGSARPDPAAQTTGAAGTPQPLIYGQGDGRQPAPEYPIKARRSGQQGTVGVRFQVGADGRVLVAEAVEPSPWPLLNQAAVRVIKDRWQFRAGPPRLYLVAINFQLEN